MNPGQTFVNLIPFSLILLSFEHNLVSFPLLAPVPVQLLVQGGKKERGCTMVKVLGPNEVVTDTPHNLATKNLVSAHK